VQAGRPYVDKLVEAGYVRRNDGILELTSAGSAAAGRLLAAGCEGLQRLLSGWSAAQQGDLAEMLDRLSHALLGEHADRRVAEAEPAAS
jgi:DNA-binding MarR family transcriptional regulator